jgi:hypothetical protein
VANLTGFQFPARPSRKRSYDDDEWERRLYLPERYRWQLHADRQRDAIHDQHADGWCGRRSDGECDRAAGDASRSLVAPARAGAINFKPDIEIPLLDRIE